ncbi:MAG: hypothetical protein BAJALOKI1v1_50022 [Promethearchaeota archaeon]|nr:MAG: hypothetical protein BAJALOKI1v1_50022 [Candidatus Lokiarchaeota archaeon]
MIVMNNISQKNLNKDIPQQVLGFCVLRFLEDISSEDFDLIFRKGVGIPLIQNVIEICKDEIMKKPKGNSIIPLEDFMIIIHFFEDVDHKKVLIIYMNEKENDVYFTQLYLFSKKVFQIYASPNNLLELKEFCNETIEIPRSRSLIGIFILNPSGSPYFTKINKERTNLADKDVQISGFISAILTFSREVISQNTGGNLKEINFGEQHFYTIIKKNIIFAYLVEKEDKLFKRYIYLIIDEFLTTFKRELEEFNGDISQFKRFGKVIDQYFEI